MNIIYEYVLDNLNEDTLMWSMEEKEREKTTHMRRGEKRKEKNKEGLIELLLITLIMICL